MIWSSTRRRVCADMPGWMLWEASKPGTVTVVQPDGSSRQVADEDPHEPRCSWFRERRAATAAAETSAMIPAATRGPT